MSNFLKLPYAGGTPRETSQVVNNLLDGKSNNTGTFTCTASAATTAVTDFRAGKSSIILLMPQTANAAAEVGNGTIHVSTRAKQSFTVTHANNSQTDRTFGYVIVG
tara:strand:- start:151 stop:468 length:318 start_codon:yes stop_codon:yes gene_type:complete